MGFYVKILDCILHLHYTIGEEQKTKKISGKLTDAQLRTLEPTKNRKHKVVFFIWLAKVYSGYQIANCR